MLKKEVQGLITSSEEIEKITLKNRLENLFQFIDKIIAIDTDLKSKRIYSITCLLKNGKEFVIKTDLFWDLPWLAIIIDGKNILD